MKNKLFYLIAAGVFIAVGVASWFLWNHKARPKTIPLPPQIMRGEIERRGEEMYRQRLYAPIIETYKEMLAKMPDNPGLKKRLAFAYFGAGRLEDARPFLEDVAGEVSADAEVFYELGFIAHRDGKTNAAQDYFKRALELDPNHKGAKEMMGR